MNDSPAATAAFILFALGDTVYGIPSELVQQMEMIERITPVPNAPAFVEGVVFSRGQVIPVINLRTRFGLPVVDYTLKTRLIVVHSHGRTVGLIVDTAREFVQIPVTAIQPPSDEISGLSGHYLAAIATLGERIILMLNVDELWQISDEAIA